LTPIALRPVCNPRLRGAECDGMSKLKATAGSGGADRECAVFGLETALFRADLNRSNEGFLQFRGD
jgi:hypothetical protein